LARAVKQLDVATSRAEEKDLAAADTRTEAPT